MIANNNYENLIIEVVYIASAYDVILRVYNTGHKLLMTIGCGIQHEAGHVERNSLGKIKIEMDP